VESSILTARGEKKMESRSVLRRNVALKKSQNRVQKKRLTQDYTEEDDSVIAIANFKGLERTGANLFWGIRNKTRMRGPRGFDGLGDAKMV